MRSVEEESAGGETRNGVQAGTPRACSFRSSSARSPAARALASAAAARSSASSALIGPLPPAPPPGFAPEKLLLEPRKETVSGPSEALPIDPEAPGRGGPALPPRADFLCARRDEPKLT